MLGGYQILDLRSIDLTLGSSASNITDTYVLNQLRNLREHIQKDYAFARPLNKQLKPVLIRYRDKKNNEKHEGAIFGSVQVKTNYYTFEISAILLGQTLNIEVVFEEKTDDDGNKYFDIKTAKILLTENADIQGDLAVGGDIEATGDASVGGDASITGDASVGGDLTVTGDINADGIYGDEIIENMEGYSFVLGTKENLTIDGIYASAVKNGNKLTLVLAVDLTRTDTVVNDIVLGTFILPQEVANKIYPSLVGSNLFVDNRVIDAWYNDSNFAELSSFVRKGMDEQSNRLYFIMNVGPVNDNLALNTKAYYRYEVTLLLSDNLIPQE